MVSARLHANKTRGLRLITQRSTSITNSNPNQGRCRMQCNACPRSRLLRTQSHLISANDYSARPLLPPCPQLESFTTLRRSVCFTCSSYADQTQRHTKIPFFNPEVTSWNFRTVHVCGFQTTCLMHTAFDFRHLITANQAHLWFLPYKRPSNDYNTTWPGHTLLTAHPMPNSKTP